MSNASHTVDKKKLLPLLIGSIGVVYGDIGTSPLYALKTCFSIMHLTINDLNVLGVISLFAWCLILVVSLKYVHIVLTMDHQGEGGTLALSTLIASHSHYKTLCTAFGILGAALFFGDGIITPAISVLSAVEGIAILKPELKEYIIPLTILILTFLFSVQRFGSSRIGFFFGPIMIFWFIIVFILGIYQIIRCPYIIKALSPFYAIKFFMQHSWAGLSIMGGVILVITGAEALYADLGHFGRKPIQISWTYFVLPALIVNYLGQGALLLVDPKSIENPFYLMAPSWALSSLIFLATLATIIASQSILSGLFSITYHSILLNYLPRLKVDHTSEDFRGQIYISSINYLIYFLTIGAVLKFNSSENLAVAYGLCAASIMFITTTLIFINAWENFKWHKIKILCVFIPFFLIDFVFLATNMVKFFEGAWYVMLITGTTYYCMRVWRKGSKALEKQRIHIHASIDKFIDKHLKNYSHRIPSTALFLSREPFKVPSALIMNLEHNKYLHEKIIFISFINLDAPYYKSNERFEIHDIKENIFQVTIKAGFMENYNLNKLLNWLKHKNILEQEENTSIFLSKGLPVGKKNPFLLGISEAIYFYLTSISQNAIDFYRIPHHRVVEFRIRYKI